MRESLLVLCAYISMLLINLIIDFTLKMASVSYQFCHQQCRRSGQSLYDRCLLMSLTFVIAGCQPKTIEVELAISLKKSHVRRLKVPHLQSELRARSPL
jgi:hypothetical protein